MKRIEIMDLNLFAVIIVPQGSGMSKGQIAGIVLGSISCAATLLLAIALIYNKTHPGFQKKVSKNRSSKSVHLFHKLWLVH